MAAALLAACGGSDKSDGPRVKDTSGLLTTPQDASKDAARGGIWSSFLTADDHHFDPLDAQRGFLPRAHYVYSQPIKMAIGNQKAPPNGSVAGDAAQSWELSDDGMQITFKLRPNVKFDPRPPTNGRAMDSGDWMYTWNNWTANPAKTPAAVELANKLNPDAPIASWSAPDKNTVVVKLAYPYAPILTMIADRRYALVIVPVEHNLGQGYDAHYDTRGSGPFYLHSYVASARIELRRNPNYWDAPRPYLDGIDQPFLSEYSVRLGQFRSGNLWTADVRAEDIIAAKRDLPQLNLWANEHFVPVTATASPIGFGKRPNSIFNDVRVRRGFSCFIDREGLMDLQHNLTGFEKEGISLASRRHTIVAAADDRFWVDYSQLGENVKYANYNPEEGGKLLKAAGIENQDVIFNIQAVASRQHEAIAGMLNGSGFFKVKMTVHDRAFFNQNLHLSRGGFDGFVTHGQGQAADPDLGLNRYYVNSPFTMFPTLLPYDDLLQKQKRELDFEKRKDLWKQIQKAWVDDLSTVIAPIPGVAQGLSLAWPRFENYPWYLSWSGNETEVIPHYWHNPSKA